MKSSLTAIIPTTGRFSLYRAVLSAQSQLDVAVEIIVVDDSINQVIDLPVNFRGKVIHTGGGMGVSKARNLGLEIVSNELVAFLDDDDEWLPDKSITQINFMNNNCLDASFTSAIVNSRILRPKRLLDSDSSPIHQIYSNAHLFRNPFYLPTASLMFNRRKFRGYFDESLTERENLKFYEDIYDSDLRIGQMSDVLVSINYSPADSLRRLNLNVELDYLESLESYSSRIRKNFILESAKNFFREGRYSESIRISKKLLDNLY